MAWNPLWFLKSKKEVPKSVLMKLARAYAYRADPTALKALKDFSRRGYKGARFHWKWAVAIRRKRILASRAMRLKILKARIIRARKKKPTRGLRLYKKKVRKVRAIKRIAKKAVRSLKHFKALKLAVRLKVPMAKRFFLGVSKIRVASRSPLLMPAKPLPPLYEDEDYYEDDYYEDNYYENDYYEEDDDYYYD